MIDSRNYLAVPQADGGATLYPVIPVTHNWIDATVPTCTECGHEIDTTEDLDSRCSCGTDTCGICRQGKHGRICAAECCDARYPEE